MATKQQILNAVNEAIPCHCMGVSVFEDLQDACDNCYCIRDDIRQAITNKIWEVINGKV